MTSYYYSVSPKYKNKNDTYENKDNRTQDHIEMLLKISQVIRNNLHVLQKFTVQKEADIKEIHFTMQKEPNRILTPKLNLNPVASL